MWDAKIENEWPVIISQITNKKERTANDFHERFSPGTLKADPGVLEQALHKETFDQSWLEGRHAGFCKVYGSCIENAFEMSPLLNHNLHCTVQVSDLISAYDFHHDVSIFHGRTEWVSVRMSIQISEVSHSRLSSTWSFHTNFCNILPFTAGNFAIVQHCQFQYE